VILLTGGAGFIGSNILRGLNDKGLDDIIVVDDLRDGTKFRNLLGTRLADYLDREEFASLLERRDARLGTIEAILHQGACTDTMCWDGALMMRDNYTASRRLLEFAQERRLPFIYASSAAVYGAGRSFAEDPANEHPLNVYGYSKQLFDDVVRRIGPGLRAPVIGLRYFNVYGPHEAHKGGMASVVLHFFRQREESGGIRLFSGSGGFGDGEQRRDFVHVDDVVAVNLWALQTATRSGLWNVGTGASRSFNDVARAVLAECGGGTIEYVPMPERLRPAYQNFTEADLRRLRDAGCAHTFRVLEDGVRAYVAWLRASEG
jgi:ADP-L-glycero-D-manno-heptose 6-epimerase